MNIDNSARRAERTVQMSSERETRSSGQVLLADTNSGSLHLALKVDKVTGYCVSFLNSSLNGRVNGEPASPSLQALLR